MTLRFIVGRILRELIGVCPPVPAGRRRLAPCAVRNRGRAVRLLVSIIPPDRIVFSIQIPSQPVTELFSQRHIAPVFGLDAAYPHLERVRGGGQSRIRTPTTATARTATIPRAVTHRPPCLCIVHERHQFRRYRTRHNGRISSRLGGP